MLEGSFAQYTIESILGEGGMSTVYKATDKINNQTVALKILKDEFIQSSEHRTTFTNEAEKAKLIDSPFIVKIFDCTEYQGIPYIALEYVEGNDLRKISENMSVQNKLELAQRILDGVLAAHETKIIHRDLKPENIIVTSDNIPKILDFGLATSVKADTVDASGNIEGTVLYSSPEQLSGEAITIGSDLFSLGVILYELFTGQLPFESDYSAGIVYSILYEDPIGPQEIYPELPDWLCDLIIHLLQKKPINRPKSVSDVLKGIEDNLKFDTPSHIAEGISKRRKTVTMVDLKNLSGDESWDYFSQGFTEEVISELRRRTDLTVNAHPSSTMSRDISAMFEKCRTDFVIMGSLLKINDKIRMSLDIYSKKGELLIFNQRYERTTDGLFILLSEAALEIAQKLAQETSTLAIDAGLETKPDITAYDFYLKGRNYYQTSRQDDLKFAEDMFNRALEIDNNYALAYAGLSDVHNVQYMFYYDRSPERANSAKDASQKAIELTPNSPDAHRAMGRYYMLCGDTEKAEKSFLKTVELNPKYAIGYRTLAWLKMMTGDLEETLKYAERALQLTPTDLETLLLISMVHMDNRHFTLALATLQRAIELGPDYGRAYYWLGEVYMKLGVPEIALENMLKAVKFQGDTNACYQAGYIYMVLGKNDSAEQKFKEAIEADQFAFIAHFYLGALHKSQNDSQEADIQFQKALAEIDKQGSEEELNIHLKAYKALILAFKGEKEKSRSMLDEIACEENHDAEVHSCMSRAFVALGDYEMAKKCIEESKDHHDGPTEKELSLDPLLKPIL